MSGSPGAGKTEASRELLQLFSENSHRILRVDPDDLRGEFEYYNGTNSFLFQRAVSILVERIHDNAIRRKQSFILDGTLSHYGVAQKNIARSIKRKRFVQIIYVYQEPIQAWKFVQARETIEGRRILPEHFITQYFAAREVTNKLKREFGDSIKIDLLHKNIDGSHNVYKANIDVVDNYVAEKYTPASLSNLLT